MDVIDFPGVDDCDETIPELAELLLSLAQIVVFVVDYKLVYSVQILSYNCDLYFLQKSTYKSHTRVAISISSTKCLCSGLLDICRQIIC